MMHVDDVLHRFSGVRRSGRGFMALCPAHDDRKPSLSIGGTRSGAILLHCFAGCPVEHVLESVGLSKRVLLGDAWSDTDRNSDWGPQSRLVSVSEPKKPPKRYRTARAAIYALEWHLGPRSRHWVYRAVDGSPVGIILRWDREENKIIRPVSRMANGWVIGGMPAPRPLYRLSELIDAERIYITEGEKAADAARSLGLIATTSAHGSQSPDKTDWSPLAGKECILLPDNDSAGEDYATTVIGLLSRLQPQPAIRVVRLPNLPAGGDIADLVEAGGERS